MSGASRKWAQWAVVAGIAGACAVAIVGIKTLMGSPVGPIGPGAARQSLDPQIVEDRTSSASPEASWIANSRARLDAMEQSTATSIATIEDQTRESDGRVDQLERAYDQQIEQMMLKITNLERRMGSTPATRVGRDQAQQNLLPAPAGEEGSPDAFLARLQLPRGGTGQTSGVTNSAAQHPASAAMVMPPMGTFGQSFTLNASAQAPVAVATGRKSLRGYVPGGTYAPAIVLTGADAATNVRGREDPVPVLFRITGSGTTAGRTARGGARVALTGCTVQGSATGDLSAERVMVRLTTITCQNSDGTVSEAAIRGYMTNSGKAGARGQVVSREGNLVNNAAIAGALEGLGSAIGTGATLGIGDRNDGEQLANRIGVGTVSGGMASAGGKLAEYYIDRAEAYQPVVSLYGGTTVELVFMEGFDL